MEESLDFISSLPSEILLQIISLIPLKEAVKTSILSTAWRSLWSPFQVDLEIDSDYITSDEASKKLIQAMAMFLKSHNSPELWKFCKYGMVFSAIKGVQKELYLDFSVDKEMKSNLDLILEPNCSISSKHSIEITSFSSLKTLHLRSVNHHGKSLVSTLFSNCLQLESLKLEKCNGLQRIDMKANICLQSFTMMDCPDMIGITVSAPNLKSFWYRGVLPQIQLKGSPQLIDVILNLREGLGQNEFDCEDVLSLLASLKDIEILTISGWLLQWLCTAGVIFRRLEFQFSKLKELRWIGSLMDRPKRDSLACFLNIVPLLEILFVKIDQSYSSISCPIFHHYWHEPHLWMDYATVKSNASELKHLKLVKLIGFTNEEDQLLLMDVLLKKAATLNSMIVTSPENQSWRVSRIPYGQLKQMARSYSKQIGISSANKECFFGLKEEDNDGLCPENGQCL